jgi:DNA-binding transcriptional LysR family regulator
MTTSKIAYKRSRLQQLQCLCETARLGSFLGAAAALDVSNPTVWKQVHALEREFGAQLVEPHGRGCHLTAAGRLLVELAGAAVESIETLRDRFQTALRDAGSDLTIAVTPQVLQVVLAPCLVQFHRRYPKVQFRFQEMSGKEIALAVEDRRADFAFSSDQLTEEQQRVLVAEPCCTLEIRLVAPKHHPLAKRRVVTPRDLLRYPIVNTPGNYYYNTYLEPVLREEYASAVAEHIVQAGFASSIRCLVELGFGIGLVPALPTTPPDERLHERSMSRYFSNMLVYLVRRRGAFTPPAGEAFIALVRDTLASP